MEVEVVEEDAGPVHMTQIVRTRHMVLGEDLCMYLLDQIP
jgi:hypothetical protein